MRAEIMTPYPLGEGIRLGRGYLIMLGASTYMWPQPFLERTTTRRFLVGNHNKGFEKGCRNAERVAIAFVKKGCVFTQGFDKIALFEVDFLVKLTVLFARDGVNEVVKGITGDKKRPLPHNLG